MNEDPPALMQFPRGMVGGRPQLNNPSHRKWLLLR
jgi:hypothetical protein